MSSITKSSASREAPPRPHASGPPPLHPELPGDGGSGGQHGNAHPGDAGFDHERVGTINARFGMLMFLAAEGMLFAGFIGAFMVFRFGHVSWPPPMQPRLPVGITGLNTFVLLISGWTMFRAYRATKAVEPKKFRTFLIATALLGIIFLSVQGMEWVRLVSFGLTLSSGIYGATFYTLIGMHGVHVFGAVIWLIIVFVRSMKADFRPARRLPLELCSMYWYFVVGLWPVLYVLVYLN